MDEPLGALDAEFRQLMCGELRALHNRLKATTVYVTHDQLEAMEMADKIAVMREGRIVQIDTPRAIYDVPSDRYVAQFVGTANLVEGTLDSPRSAGEQAVVSTSAGPMVAARVSEIAPESESVVVTSKASCWTIARDEPPTGPNVFRAVVERATYLGSYTEYLVRLGAQSVRIWADSDPEFLTGEEVWVGVDPQHCRVVA